MFSRYGNLNIQIYLWWEGVTLDKDYQIILIVTLFIGPMKYQKKGGGQGNREKELILKLNPSYNKRVGYSSGKRGKNVRA